MAGSCRMHVILDTYSVITNL